MFGKPSPPPPPPDEDRPPPFRWADVEARLTQADRIHDFATDAAKIWAPILASLQAEQRRMKARGLL